MRMALSIRCAVCRDEFVQVTSDEEDPVCRRCHTGTLPRAPVLVTNHQRAFDEPTAGERLAASSTFTVIIEEAMETRASSTPGNLVTAAWIFSAQLEQSMPVTR